MALELNLTKKDQAGEGFKEYPGKNIEQQPLIVAAGRIPMRAAHLMGMRILHPQSDWMSNYYDRDDRIAYHSSGARFKVGSRGELRDYREHGVLVNGAVEFDDVEYEALPWPEFQKNALIHEQELLGEEAKTHALWFELSQRNQGLLDAFVETQYRVGNYSEAMGMYLDSGMREKAWMRASYVLGLGLGSRFVGRSDLDFVYGRLVGVAPEALVRLERRLRDEKKINVDFMSALGEQGVAYGMERTKRAPVEVKSESGFLPEKKHDIVVETSLGVRSVPETHLASVLCEIEQGGKLNSAMRELILRRVREENEKHE